MAGIMQELESVRAVFEEHRTATDACPFCLSARREHGTSWSFVKENHCRPAGHKWLPKYLLSALQEQSAPPTKDPDEDNPLTLPETAIRQDLIEHRKLTEETIAKFQGDIVDMQQKLDVATEAWREDYLAVRLAVKERYELLKAKIIEEHRKRKVELEDNQQRLEKQLQKTKQVYGDLFSKRTAVWKTKSQSPEREEEIERRGLECINGCPTVFQLGMRFEYADTNKSLAMEDIKQFGELKSDAIPDKEIIVEYAPICTLLKVAKKKEERGSDQRLKAQKSQKSQQSSDTKAAMDDEKMGDEKRDDSVPFDVDAIGPGVVGKEDAFDNNEDADARAWLRQDQDEVEEADDAFQPGIGEMDAIPREREHLYQEQVVTPVDVVPATVVSEELKASTPMHSLSAGGMRSPVSPAIISDTPKQSSPLPLAKATPKDPKRDKNEMSVVIHSHTFALKTNAQFVKLFQQLGRAYTKEFATNPTKPKWGRKTADSLTCIVKFADGRKDHELGTVTFNSREFVPEALWNGSATLLLLFPDQLEQYRMATEPPPPAFSPPPGAGSAPAAFSKMASEDFGRERVGALPGAGGVEAAATGEAAAGILPMADERFADYKFKKSYKLKVSFEGAPKPKTMALAFASLSADVAEATRQMREKIDERVKDWGLAPGQYSIFHQETGNRVDTVNDLKALIVDGKKLKFEVRKEYKE